MGMSAEPAEPGLPAVSLPAALVEATSAAAPPRPASDGTAPGSPDAGPQTQQAPRPTPKDRLRRLRFALSLRNAVTFLTVGMISAFGVLMVSLTQSVLQENKLRDVWAIYYLEMEQFAHDLAAALLPKLTPQDMAEDGEALIAVPEVRWTAASLYELTSETGLKHAAGPDLGVDDLAAFAVKRQGDLASWNLLVRGEQRYAAILLAPRAADEGGGAVRRLAILPFGKRIGPEAAKAARDKSLIYIATRQAHLVFSNSPEVTGENFQERALVQKFIETPIWKGQIALPTDEHHDIFGFFVDVPQTNLVIFAETSQEVVTRAVVAETRRLLIIVTIGVLVVATALFLVLTRLLDAIGKVAKTATVVATGNFDVAVEELGFGETLVLTSSFAKMIAGLKHRDSLIAKLTIEQIEKVRLAKELEVAKGIQENLLSDAIIPASAEVSVRCFYRPAGECAGDWFGYFSLEDGSATLVFIVDVSGHGAGSSMFTAIAAAIFEEFRVTYKADIDPTVLFHRFHHQLARYGRQAWHASCQLVIFQRGKPTLTIINAGHPQPFIGPSADGAFKAVRGMASDVLGLAPELTLAKVEVPFAPGQLCILYTDGLLEMKSPASRNLGAKAMSACLQQMSNAEAAIDSLVKTADSHAKGCAQEDDICIIAIKSLARSQPSA
jgi:serine phosphatase RsbU (regulator of sigma subunit)